ncbi:MAG: hypothetical protein RBR93_08425 [Aliarcobacter butzleri]|nr:hypothetical protein [Aliarcobacter butzleri]
MNMLNRGEREFIKYNKNIWAEKKGIKKEVILIQGSSISGGPNYLFRTATIAKKLESIFNYKSVVVLNKEKCHAKKDFQLYHSYNINDYIYSKIFYKSIFRYIKAYFIALALFKKVIKDNNLATLKYKGVLIGDFIYDDIIKSYKGKKLNSEVRVTVEKIIDDDFRFFFATIDYFLIYQNILEKNNVKYLVTTHTQFSEYGLLARLAYRRMVSVFETTDISLVYSDANKQNIVYPSCHSTLREHIKDAVNNTTNKDILVNDAIKELKLRHQGKIQQYDVKLAYYDKKLYTKQDLKEVLNIKNNNPFVIVMCHIFADASLSGGDGMLFDDYYKWLHSTLEEAAKIKNINWIVKPHPASKQYKEDGIVKKEVEGKNYDNIFLSPEDFSTASIINTIDAIVTARGTAGLEYSCFKIPTIMAGRAFYSEFGFTIDSSSKSEYINNLKSVGNLSKLNDEQANKARLVYYYFNKFSTLENDKILTIELINKIRGTNGDRRDINRAYEILKENLEKYGFEKWSHFKLIEEFVKDDI